MKFITHQSGSEQPSKWVYFAESGEEEAFGDMLRFDVTDNLDRASTETPEAANDNRTEVASIQARNAVGEMLDDDDQVFSLDPTLKPPSDVTQIVGLRNFLTGNWRDGGQSPEAFFWKKLIPWKAWRFWLGTKRSIWNYAEKVGPQMMDMMEDSPQFYTRNDSALMNQTAIPTVKALKKGSDNPKNTSLMAIDFWEKTSTDVIEGFEKEHAEFASDVEGQLETEESFKKFIRKWPLFGQKKRVGFMIDQQKKQLEIAKEEIKNNIPSLRKARTDHLQTIRAKLSAYPKSAELKLQQSAQNKLESFAAEILQDPEGFINNPQSEYCGVNWRQQFCDKPIDMLEVLNLEFGDRVIARASKSYKLEQDQDATLKNIDERTEAANDNFANNKLQEVRNILASQGIEPAPKAERGGEERNLSEREVIRTIHNALSQTHQDIDLERDIYHTSLPRLTAEEKIAIMTRYLVDNPEILKDMEEVAVHTKDGNRSASCVLARYCLEVNETTQTPRSLGSLSEEGPTDNNRFFVAQQSERLIANAKDIFGDGFFGQIQSAIRHSNAEEFENCRQKLLDFKVNFEGFAETIGYSLDGETPEGSLLGQLPEQDRFIASNVLKLKGFYESLTKTPYEIPNSGEAEPTQINGLIDFLNFSRNRYFQNVLENLPPPIEGAYEQELDRVNAAINSTEERMIQEIQAGRMNQAQATEAARTQLTGALGGGLNLRADMQTSADTLEDLIRPLRNRIETWDKALRAKESFAVALPGNPKEFFDAIFSRTEAPLAQLKSSLEAGGAEVPPIPGLNERAKKYFSAKMSEKAEAHFAKRYNENMRQQWDLLQSMNVGHEVSTLKFGDLTHLDGIFNLSSGVTSRESFSNLQLYRKESDRLLFESNGEDGVIIAMTAPKDLSTTFSFEETEADDFIGHANCLIYKKSELEQDVDGLFRVPQTNFNKAGIVLNTGSSQAAEYKRPDQNARRAEKGWFGYKNIAA